MIKLTARQKEQARTKIQMLEGLPPYNVPSNICYGDGHFAQSIIREYGLPIRELKIEIGM